MRPGNISNCELVCKVSLVTSCRRPARSDTCPVFTWLDPTNIPSVNILMQVSCKEHREQPIVLLAAFSTFNRGYLRLLISNSSIRDFRFQPTTWGKSHILCDNIYTKFGLQPKKSRQSVLCTSMYFRSLMFNRFRLSNSQVRQFYKILGQSSNHQQSSSKTTRQIITRHHSHHPSTPLALLLMEEMRRSPPGM